MSEAKTFTKISNNHIYLCKIFRSNAWRIYLVCLICNHFRLHYRKRVLRQTLLAKAFPTGFPSSCWERTVGVLSDGKELFANRNSGPVGKASPTAMCAVGEEGTPSARMPLPSPTGKRRLLAKSCWQREWQLCQQLALPTASGEAVGKSAGQGCWQKSPALPTAGFANSFGPGCWQSWARASGEAYLCQQPGPKMLAKLGRLVRKAQLCQQLWPMLLAKLGISPLFSLF
jgi:hypothetical protein